MNEVGHSGLRGPGNRNTLSHYVHHDTWLVRRLCLLPYHKALSDLYWLHAGRNY